LIDIGLFCNALIEILVLVSKCGFFLPEASNFNPKTSLARGEAFNPNLPNPIEKRQTLTLKPPWQAG
jgi:hypothetical protein